MNPTARDCVDQGQSQATALEEPPTASVQDDLDERLARLEARLLERVEERLDQVRSQVVDTVGAILTDSLPTLVERAVKKQLGTQGGGAALDADRARQLFSTVFTATFVESGILGKLIARTVESKLKSVRGAGPDDGAGSGQAGLPEITKAVHAEVLKEVRKEIIGVVQKETAAVLSSENMKVLIDDKFRAISIYLKTDVIPKTVTQLLKSVRLPQGPA